MKIEILVEDEVLDDLISAFCAEHIELCDHEIDWLGRRMRIKDENLPDLLPHQKRDLEDAKKWREHLVGVYNYCNVEKWKDVD